MHTFDTLKQFIQQAELEIPINRQDTLQTVASKLREISGSVEFELEEYIAAFSAAFPLDKVENIDDENSPFHEDKLTASLQRQLAKIISSKKQTASPGEQGGLQAQAQQIRGIFEENTDDYDGLLTALSEKFPCATVPSKALKALALHDAAFPEGAQLQTQSQAQTAPSHIKLNQSSSSGASQTAFRTKLEQLLSEKNGENKDLNDIKEVIANMQEVLLSPFKGSSYQGKDGKSTAERSADAKINNVKEVISARTHNTRILSHVTAFKNEFLPAVATLLLRRQQPLSSPIMKSAFQTYLQPIISKYLRQFEEEKYKEVECTGEAGFFSSATYKTTELHVLDLFADAIRRSCPHAVLTTTPQASQQPQAISRALSATGGGQQFRLPAAGTVSLKRSQSTRRTRPFTSSTTQERPTAERRRPVADQASTAALTARQQTLSRVSQRGVRLFPISPEQPPSNHL